MTESKPRDGWIDGRLPWLEWGGGPGDPVLLVHGIAGNARNWEAFAAAAGGARRLVALDLRGHGESACAEGESYGHPDYLADLLEAIERLGPPVAIVGHSIGAHVCLILAALRPDLVTSLVVLDIEACLPREQPEGLRRSGGRPHPVFASLQVVVEELRGSLPEIAEPLLRAKAEHDTRVLPDGRRSYRFDRGVLRAVTAPDARPYLPRIRCPVLLLRGAARSVMRAEVAKEMAAALPCASLVEIPGAGHGPQLANPEAFAEAVFRFLGGTGGRRAPA